MSDPNDPYGDPYKNDDATPGDASNDPAPDPAGADDYELSEPVQPDPSQPPPPPSPMQGAPAPAMRCQNCQADLAGATLGGHCPQCGAPIVATGYPTGQTSGKAIASLVMGILSIPMCLCCGLVGVILGPLAIFFGHQAKKDIADGTASPGSAGMATAGLICGIIGTVFGVLSLIINVVSLLMNP